MTPTDDNDLQVARLPNGVQLAYDVAGHGPTLVFIHGAMGDWRSWDPQWAAFTPHFRCLRYSRRYNHPNPNRMPSPNHSAVQEAEDLRLLLDHLGWDRVVLVGSSYGAFIALVLAVQQPERFPALALVEPPMMRYAQHSAAGQAAAAAFRTATIEPANAAFRRGDDEEGARIMTGGINGANTATLDAAAMHRRLQNIQAMKMLAMSTDEFPLVEPAALAGLPMPVLLMAGANTPAVHSTVFDNVCAAMPQAQHLRVPQAGHGVARENPAVYNRAVLDFLATHLDLADAPSV